MDEMTAHGTVAGLPQSSPLTKLTMRPNAIPSGAAASHTTMPDGKNFEWVMRNFGEIVKETVTQPAPNQ